ncbi:MAG: hypothetical protein J4428_00950 [Candidatus Aenigmarchaeota archaeon]|nr:hypothetical protein [Candidatus Aenigmarchaeota archaeon]
MCNPTIGKVLKTTDKKVVVLVNKREIDANTELVKVKTNDYVLLAGNIVIEKITKREALTMLNDKE